MADPDPHEDTSADHEQFEKAQFAQDRDAADVDTADIDDATAQNLTSDLIDVDVITLAPEEHVLVHEPGGAAFESIQQLAVFHRSWTAGRDTDVEGE